MTETNIQTVKNHLAAVRDGDMQAFLATITDDVQFHAAGDPDVPWTGQPQGKEAAERVLREAWDAVTFEVMELRDVVAAGDRVAAIYHERTKVNTTGRSYEQDVAVVCRMRDGKIAEAWGFEDTAAVQRAFKSE